MLSCLARPPWVQIDEFNAEQEALRKAQEEEDARAAAEAAAEAASAKQQPSKMLQLMQLAKEKAAQERKEESKEADAKEDQRAARGMLVPFCVTCLIRTHAHTLQQGCCVHGRYEQGQRRREATVRCACPYRRSLSMTRLTCRLSQTHAAARVLVPQFKMMPACVWTTDTQLALLLLPGDPAGAPLFS